MFYYKILYLIEQHRDYNTSVNKFRAWLLDSATNRM